MSFYINLDSRTDRKEQFEEECKRMDLQVERVSAIRHDIGAIGCGESHLAVIKKARDLKLESVTIFEDDFQFLVSRDEYDHIVSNLPSDYDIVMLSYNMRQCEPFNDMFGIVKECWTTSGYIVHSCIYDRLIETWEEGLEFLKQPPHEVEKYALDVYWKRIDGLKWYYSLKRVGLQRPSWSDLVRQHVDYQC
jgi:GR25 family glycosyltransferase involved in LPS biosynthesis